MSTQTTSAPLFSPRRALNVVVAGALSVLAAAVLAAPAGAVEPIESFNASLSTDQAGGHPDINFDFALEDPGEPEAAKEVILNAPEGLFGNPNAVPRCTSVDYALQQCQTASQVGIVTIRANYSGNPNNLLGTAPLYYVEPQTAEETVRFAFIVPSLQIPISTPVAVRTGSDYGLRFSVSGLTQLIPLAGAKMSIWGFPAAGSNNGDRFAKGSPGSPAGCPGLEDTSCEPPAAAGIAVHPMINNPTVCTGEPLDVELSARTYQDPNNLSHKSTQFPPMTGCEKLNFYPVLNADVTTNETDAPSGLDLELAAKQFESFAFSPSQIRSAIVTLPDGLTINPDAADGQTACPDALANFNSEAPANCPDNAKIGTMEMERRPWTARFSGRSTSGNRSPGTSTGYSSSRTASASTRSWSPVDPSRSADRTGDSGMSISRRFPSTVSTSTSSPRSGRSWRLRRTARPTPSNPTFFPWNSVLAPQPSTPKFGLGTTVPTGGPARLRCGPSTRGSWRERRIRSPARSAASI